MIWPQLPHGMRGPAQVPAPYQAPDPRLSLRGLEPSPFRTHPPETRAQLSRPREWLAAASPQQESR